MFHSVVLFLLYRKRFLGKYPSQCIVNACDMRLFVLSVCLFVCLSVCLCLCLSLSLSALSLSSMRSQLSFAFISNRVLVRSGRKKTRRLDTAL